MSELLAIVEYGAWLQPFHASNTNKGAGQPYRHCHHQQDFKMVWGITFVNNIMNDNGICNGAPSPQYHQ